MHVDWKPVRALIADDHPLFRQGLRGQLESRGFEVVGETQTGWQAVELSARLCPDVVLLDLAMPALGGLAATWLLSVRQPHVKVVVLTASEDESDVFEAIKSGARVSRQEVLRLLVQGMTTTQELSAQLVVSANTVKFHLRNILDKLHVHNRAGVVAYASRYGLAPPMA